MYVAIVPPKTYPPLLVDADGILAFPVAFQGFEFIARRNIAIFQPDSGVQDSEFVFRPLDQVCRQDFRSVPKPEFFSVFICETLDWHVRWYLTHTDFWVKIIFEKRKPTYPVKVSDGMPAFFPWWEDPEFEWIGPE